MDCLSILNECASDNGRLFKIDVVDKNKDNELFKSVIKAALDPYTQYHIRKIPEYIKTDAPDISLCYALDELKRLSSRELTGNTAKNHLECLLANLSPSDAEVIERIISKDLKCGIHKSTVNKVFGKGFIETYPCMLASSMNEKNFKNIKFPGAIIQTKMDGMRANIIIDSDGKVDIRSRNGKQIDLHGMLDISGMFDIVIDGELIVLDDDGNILDRKTGNGILNSAVRGTITPEEAERVRMVAWDIIPLEDFKVGRFDMPYSNRLDNLKFTLFVEDKIDIVETSMADNMDEVRMIFQEALDAGQEGVIVKNTDSIWEDKRSKHQVKMKVELEADLLVTAWNEGAGKYKGLMGSVTAVTDNGQLEVNVGSGFNDEDRKMLPEDIVGKIITVKYNEVIQDKNKDTKSLFLPIFVEIRLDKDKADNI